MTEAETGAILGTDSTWEDLLTFRTEEVVNTEYALTCYVNDINREYAEVLTEYTVSGSKTDNIFSSITGTEEIQVLTDYVYGNQRIYGTGETTAYYLYDGTGSVTEQVNQRADLLNTYRYDPHGTLTSGNVGERNYYGYRGEETNPTTGMQYLRYRYYDTAAGRFQTPDSYLGSLIQPISQNRYGYTGNNPVMYGDKSGHIPYFLITTVVGAVVGAMVGSVTSGVTKAVEVFQEQRRTGDYNPWRFANEVAFASWAGAAGGFVSGGIEGALAPFVSTVGVNSVVGAGSNTIGGIVTRYIEATLSNTFLTYKPKVDVMDYTFAPEAITLDAGIGALSVVAGFGLNKALSQIAKKIPAVEAAMIFINQRSEVCAIDNRISSGIPEGSEIADEVVEEGLEVLSTPNSRVLRQNMIDAGVEVPDYPNAAHHIVAGNSAKAEEARAILQKFGIDINDPVNGVFLPTVKDTTNSAYHPSLHTNAYYDEVNSLLAEATSKEEVIETLEYIAESLQKGTFMR